MSDLAQDNIPGVRRDGFRYFSAQETHSRAEMIRDFVSKAGCSLDDVIVYEHTIDEVVGNHTRQWTGVRLDVRPLAGRRP